MVGDLYQIPDARRVLTRQVLFAELLEAHIESEGRAFLCLFIAVFVQTSPALVEVGADTVAQRLALSHRPHWILWQVPIAVNVSSIFHVSLGFGHLFPLLDQCLFELGSGLLISCVIRGGSPLLNCLHTLEVILSIESGVHIVDIGLVAFVLDVWRYADLLERLGLNQVLVPIALTEVNLNV